MIIMEQGVIIKWTSFQELLLSNLRVLFNGTTQ